MIPFSYPQAPYFLLVASLLASLASGLAFSSVLKHSVEAYLRDRNPTRLAPLRGLSLLLPYWGVCGGVCVFLASSVQLFAFSAKLAYMISLPLTLLSGVLVWRQLLQILQELELKGPNVLKLDMSKLKS